MDSKKFGEFIATIRKEKGWTQAELAEKISVTDKAVSRWERGLGFPDINTIKPLADVLEVSVLEIMQSEREPKEEISADKATEVLDNVISLVVHQRQIERRNIIKAYGAEIVLTEGAKGMKGAIEKAEEIKNETSGAVILGQFVNPSNPKVHKLTTGPEIWEDTDGQVDIFVAGVGTGGTVTGVGEYLKSKNPSVKVVAVEPKDSPVLSEGRAGAHKIQGIGAGFVPEVLNTEIYDEIIPVANEDAFEAGKAIAKTEGVLVGISSGAALFAAKELAKRPENKGKNIVVLLPDSGDRYYSTALFQ